MKYVFRALPALLLIFFLSSARGQATSAPLTEEQRRTEIQELHQQLNAIAVRLSALEAQHPATATGLPPVPASPTPQTTPAQDSGITKEDRETLAFFRGTTLSFGLDGYYGYNFNVPVGGVNLLRAYDVTSNSFNINQASLIIEHLPTTTQRFGGRLDLQYGQATETLQGSSANEQRPQVWRNLFQAYGTYLAPVGSGLQIDFGKFASSLGNEGNYTKDQITYSRAYSFNYLPFYHMGFRMNYNVTSKLNVAYWLVNGANDTEDLNGFKSQAFLFTIKPSSTLSWNVNYYFGEEGRAFEPNQSALPTTNINPVPDGREHIFDTYATWTATPKLTVVGEADYVLNRTQKEQQPPRVVLGSLTAKYALPHRWNLGGRFEYFDDRGGLFSGKTQSLKEGTLSLDHQFAEGFLARAEYRRDFSNQPFFLTDTTGVLVHAQSTATLGLVYWWGMKQGSW
ncbi:MAG: outer membrane beta-barrel protein [Acidobacteriaceae bacterium]|nr:outer membrane beta-barrel protein [Acidobacteriaceae bacterium]